MISPKLFFKLFPWLLLITIVFTLYLTNHWPFGNEAKKHQIFMESTAILQEIENLGKLELVKYNFKEVFEYKELSEGQIVGKSIIQNYSYEPDLSVVLIASGEAVGCIDLTKLAIENIEIGKDTVIVSLPPPELCYYKLDLENTKVHSFSKESWWSRLFSNEDEKTEILQTAYRQAEHKLKEAAIESGIFQSTNENSVLFLTPMLESITGRKVKIITSIPETIINLGR